MERGASIYVRSCSGCHGPDGRGIDRPGLTNRPRDLTDPEWQESMSDEAIQSTIRTGKGQMPAFGGLIPKEDLDHLVLYLRSLGRPPP